MNVVELIRRKRDGFALSPAEVRAVAEVAKRHRLVVHMDGARLANALARLGCAPAEITWKAGVDILSFGMTKNGGALCDAIVVFGAENRVVANVVEVAGGEGLLLSGNLNVAQDNSLRATSDTGLHVAAGIGNTLSTNLVIGCGGAGFLDEGTATVLSRNRID